MHFPTYQLLKPKFALRFWPEASDGACFCTSGQVLTQRDKDKDGNDVMRPVHFVNSNRNHIRFASKRKCLQWLQKMNRVLIHIHSAELLIHTK